VRHEDFNSLEAEQVIAKILTYCKQKTAAKAVHWLSSYGLQRVHESSNETWHWAFSTADVVDRHVISFPQADVFDLFHVWRKVAGLYPQMPTVRHSAHLVSQVPVRYYSLPLTWNEQLLGILLLEDVDSVSPVALLGRLQPALDVAVKYVAFAYEHLEARNMSYMDELTGLYNQRYLGGVLTHEIERARRENSQFSLLFLDIDYFKLVNDGRGHWVGSKLLVELGRVLRSQVRTCDYAFRYGGDEFIILLTNSNAQNSQKVAERMRQLVESHSFTVEGHTLNLTVSIGLAAYPQHAQSASGLIQLADQAMYYGKRKSRNVVFVAS
jgi:diguanylate cyclase (GGDEF)-like protein